VSVAARGLSHSYGELRSLRRIDLAVADGEVVALVGPSGCGKSTLLEIVCGLRDPSEGEIEVGGAADAAGRLARCAYMPQRDLLLPWFSALDNAALALRNRGTGKADARREAGALFERFGLAGFEAARPGELSGGMRQRVALARALGQNASVLLMDEPFGAIDAITRDLLHDELERVWQETGVTIVFVTHNVAEAVRLGDRVLVLSSRPGRVVAEFPVTIPRPRRLDSPAVSLLSASITDRLRQEVRRHGDA
jgi:NitT/TauT family transport system ATP-binding protein